MKKLLDDLAETVIEPQAMRRSRIWLPCGVAGKSLAAADEELLELHYVEDLGSRQIADRLQRLPTECVSTR